MYSLLSWFKFYRGFEEAVGQLRSQWEELAEAGLTIGLVILLPEDTL